MSGADPAFRLALRFCVYLDEILILVFCNLGRVLYNSSVSSRYEMVNFFVWPAAAARLIGLYYGGYSVGADEATPMATE